MVYLLVQSDYGHYKIIMGYTKQGRLQDGVFPDGRRLLSADYLHL